jgi:hypothetical protein
MKAGFTVDTVANNTDKVFILFNNEIENEVVLLGFKDIKTARGVRLISDIGVWQPKGTKQQSNK